MKHFVQYVDMMVEMGARRSVRVLEIEDVKPPEERRAKTIAMLAPETACKLAVVEMSRQHPDNTFSWGHEEADGRTWLHGFALNGVYRDGDGKVVVKRRMSIVNKDQTTETVRPENDDPFEIDLNNDRWSGASSIMFFVNGVEAASVYLKKEEE